AHLAARGDRVAVKADNGDRRRALRNDELLPGRQTQREDNKENPEREDAPETEHHAPIGETPDADLRQPAAALPFRARFALCTAIAARAPGRAAGAVGFGQAQMEERADRVEHGLALHAPFAPDGHVP